jgi:clan AA aspartic protease
MGTVFADVTLINSADVEAAARGYINKAQVRQVTVNSKVDTGAMTLIISEDIQNQLGLQVVETRSAAMADNTEQTCYITEPVEIHWKDRMMSCGAWVLPGIETVLLGAIPLEGMDLAVFPTRNELAGAHGKFAVAEITDVSIAD